MRKKYQRGDFRLLASVRNFKTSQLIFISATCKRWCENKFTYLRGLRVRDGGSDRPFGNILHWKMNDITSEFIDRKFAINGRKCVPIAELWKSSVLGQNVPLDNKYLAFGLCKPDPGVFFIAIPIFHNVLLTTISLQIVSPQLTTTFHGTFDEIKRKRRCLHKESLHLIFHRQWKSIKNSINKLINLTECASNTEALLYTQSD